MPRENLIVTKFLIDITNTKNEQKNIQANNVNGNVCKQ